MFEWQSMLPVADPMLVAVPLLLFVAIGWVHYRVHSGKAGIAGALRHVFPAALYRQQANQVGWFNAFLSLSLLFKGSGTVSALLAAVMLWDGGAAAGVAGATGQVMLIWLARDLGNYVQHLAQHRSALLWRLHRPHHAAEALTPFVQVQGHPLDLLLGMAIEFPFTLAGGVLALALFGGFGPATYAGLAVVAGVGQLKGALGHSHLDICFGKWNRLMLGPVMHQLHHSAEPEHRDRNLGSTFGLWDWMFGTLYVPARGERWRLGLNPESLGADNPYRSVAAIYGEPILALLGRGQRVDRGLEDVRGGHVVDPLGALRPAEILFDHRPLDRDGRPALVPQQDGEAQIVEVTGEGAGGLSARAIAAVEIEGQADDEARHLLFRDQIGERGLVLHELAAADQRGGRGEAPLRVA